ncbi:hypothetical protein [Niabella hibiscisoli]|uniref:hypothetical protein n=1 Tax=Niabella hibiscisoli TaxID=1825928 RepID=UPI001F109574|nr:hypothetical protein [Niabella hibiscisoli]MCH5715694.1 hypothetical protein [Niabella hibiscisoli]
MKNVLVLLSLTLSSFATAIAQTDVLYTINNDISVGTGITQHGNVNPNNATVGGTSTNYATGDGTTNSAAMAMSANGQFIYYIAQTTNTGDFEVRSIPAYPAPGVTTAPTAGTVVLSADANGADNNLLYFRRLGTAPNGWAYMVTTEELTGQIYLSRFLTDGTTGGASNFQNLGTITLDGIPLSPNFNNGDLVIDGSGNMYILVNLDATGGEAVIYYVSAATLAAANTPTSVTNITTKYVIKNEAGVNFQGLVTGLALSSTGTFYVAVQGPADGGIYYINTGVLDGVVTIKGPGNTANNDGLADLTTAYFPATTVLPVTYNTIEARISGNRLIVDWSTLSESNNARFDVEVSADGKKFVNIGSVATKALNGNSDSKIEYSFTKAIDLPVAVMGISLFSLAGILLLVNRKNKLLLSVMMVMGVGLTFASCSKNGDQVDVSGEGKLFVRIVQVDKDGKTSTSKVITAYKAN